MPYLPNDPDFAQSDYHLFISLKKKLEGEHFANDNAVKEAVLKWLKETGRKF